MYFESKLIACRLTVKSLEMLRDQMVEAGARCLLNKTQVILSTFLHSVLPSSKPDLDHASQLFFTQARSISPDSEATLQRSAPYECYWTLMLSWNVIDGTVGPVLVKSRITNFYLCFIGNAWKCRLLTILFYFFADVRDAQCFFFRRFIGYNRFFL